MVKTVTKKLPDRLTPAEQVAFRKHLAGQGLSQKEFAASKRIDYYQFNATVNGYRGNPVCLKVIREFIKRCEEAESHA